MAVRWTVFGRCAAVALIAVATAACGGDDDTETVIGDDTSASSTTAPEETTSVVPSTEPEPVTPADLEFRPVLELLPPGGVPAPDGGAAEGCATPEEAWSADQTVLAPEVQAGEEIACHRLGPDEIDSDIVESAAAVEDPLGNWGISLVLTTDGVGAFNAVAGACFEGASTCPTRQLAIVVDRTVISAPSINAPSFERDAISISGDFTQAEAEALAAGVG